MKKHTITTYSFNELSDKAKDKAVELLYDINVDEDWWDSTYEDAAMVGIKITSFETYRVIDGEFVKEPTEVARLIIANHGKDTPTYANAKEYLRVENKGYDQETLDETFLHDLLEDYLVILAEDYEYLISTQAIIETIEMNEYEFTKDGKLF